MNRKKSKKEPKKQQLWDPFTYLATLATGKEPVIIHLNTNAIEDESQQKGAIIEADNYTLAFLTNNGRELLVLKHAIRFIEMVGGK